MEEKTFDDENELMDDMTALNGLMKTMTRVSAQSPGDLDAVYSELYPAIKKVSRGTAPERFDPSYVESAIVYTNDPGGRVSEIRQLRGQENIRQESRAGIPFDPTNPVDAQFLDENGQASFNNENYGAFLKTRGFTDEQIQNLEKPGGVDIISDLQQMRPEEQIQVVNTLAKIAEHDEKRKANARKNDPRKLTEATKSTVQKDIVGITKAVQQLDEIRQIAKPEFLQTPDKVWNNLNSVKDRFNLTDGQARQLIKERSYFKGRVQNFFSTEVHRLSGGQVGEEEFKRRAEEILNVGMTPAQFQGMLDATHSNLLSMREINQGMIDRDRLLSSEELEAIKTSRLQALPGFRGEQSLEFNNLRNSEIQQKIDILKQSGELKDNDILRAAIQITKNRGEIWEELPDQEKHRRFDILGGRVTND